MNGSLVVVSGSGQWKEILMSCDFEFRCSRHLKNLQQEVQPIKNWGV